MIDELLRRRALIVVGKGGVGRSSVSGALATVRAADPARVLAMEYDRLGALLLNPGGPGESGIDSMGLFEAVLSRQDQGSTTLSI